MPSEFPPSAARGSPSRRPGWRPAAEFPARGRRPRSSARRSAARCARPAAVAGAARARDQRRGLHEVRPRTEHVRNGRAHRILSVHLNPLPSAAVTTTSCTMYPPRPASPSRLRPRSRWRRVTANESAPWCLPGEAAGRCAAGSGRWAVRPGGDAVGSGRAERGADVARDSPRRLAAFALAVDQPAAAAAALDKLAWDERGRSSWRPSGLARGANRRGHAGAGRGARPEGPAPARHPDRGAVPRERVHDRGQFGPNRPRR